MRLRSEGVETFVTMCGKVGSKYRDVTSLNIACMILCGAGWTSHTRTPVRQCAGRWWTDRRRRIVTVCSRLNCVRCLLSCFALVKQYVLEFGFEQWQLLPVSNSFSCGLGGGGSKFGRGSETFVTRGGGVIFTAKLCDVIYGWIHIPARLSTRTKKTSHSRCAANFRFCDLQRCLCKHTNKSPCSKQNMACLKQTTVH
jgi:hypothetical protein